MKNKKESAVREKNIFSPEMKMITVTITKLPFSQHLRWKKIKIFATQAWKWLLVLNAFPLLIWQLLFRFVWKYFFYAMTHAPTFRITDYQIVFFFEGNDLLFLLHNILLSSSSLQSSTVLRNASFVDLNSMHFLKRHKCCVRLQFFKMYQRFNLI